MVGMHEGKLKIHSENILPIIKKWLYSDKDIFVRELVSNACDALLKAKKIYGETLFRIDVRIDATQRTLTFSDNGIGMSDREVETYIAQIAFSGAEEFVHKYHSAKEEDQVIGHFGLGFYSAYMVAQTVEIQTNGAETPAVHWTCDGSSSYTMGEGIRTERGTDVILHLTEEEGEYLDEARIRAILKKNCSFLPYPVFLNDKRINEHEPLWIKDASQCTEKEYVDFYRQLFPLDEVPLFWIHLNIDYPFHLKGILYFPKIGQGHEWKKESIHLYCNRVFVSDNCKEILPEYLMILLGVIDSPNIPLNVSRSALQMDRTVRQLGQHISKKIAERLTALYRSEREKFLEYWPDVEVIVKYGALSDDKFYERVKELLLWKSSRGGWLTVEEYRERHQGETVYYATQEGGQMIDLYKDREVLFVAPTPLDLAVIHSIERHAQVQFKRVDSALDAAILDPKRERSLLDAEGKSEAARIADFFRKQIDSEVEAKSLASDELPAFLLLKEEERRMRDHFAFQKHKIPLKPTFVVNTNNRLIHAVMMLNRPELAQKVARMVYDLACIAQQEMKADELDAFVRRSTEVLADLLTRQSEELG